MVNDCELTAHCLVWVTELVTGQLTHTGDQRECMRHCCGFTVGFLYSDQPWFVETEEKLKAVCDEPARRMGCDPSLIRALTATLWKCFRDRPATASASQPH